jgi:hypothetical protein
VLDARLVVCVHSRTLRDHTSQCPLTSPLGATSLERAGGRMPLQQYIRSLRSANKTICNAAADEDVDLDNPAGAVQAEN